MAVARVSLGHLGRAYSPLKDYQLYFLPLQLSISPPNLIIVCESDVCCVWTHFAPIKRSEKKVEVSLGIFLISVFFRNLSLLRYPSLLRCVNIVWRDRETNFTSRRLLRVSSSTFLLCQDNALLIQFSPSSYTLFGAHHIWKHLSSEIEEKEWKNHNNCRRSMLSIVVDFCFQLQRRPKQQHRMVLARACEPWQRKMSWANFVLTLSSRLISATQQSDVNLVHIKLNLMQRQKMSRLLLHFGYIIQLQPPATSIMEGKPHSMMLCIK